jgi:hypothetical protein
MPKNIRNFDVSSGGFSMLCVVDMMLSSVDAVLGVAELLGEGSKDASADEAIVMYIG